MVMLHLLCPETDEQMKTMHLDLEVQHPSLWSHQVDITFVHYSLFSIISTYPILTFYYIGTEFRI